MHLDPNGFAAALALARGSVGTAPGVVALPLRNSRGRVQGWAEIDSADAPAFAQWRWYLAGGYVVRNIRIPGIKEQRTLGLHRAVMGLAYGDPGHVDHRNRDKRDNRRSNLRILTNGQNCQNVDPAGLPNTSSRYRGVSWSKRTNRWIAQAWLDRKKYYLGSFRDEDDAGAAVRAWRREHMPFATE